VGILCYLAITLFYVTDLYDKIKPKFPELTQYKAMFTFL